MGKTAFSNKTKILAACMIVWAIVGAIIVVAGSWSIWILGIPLIVLFIPTLIFAVSDIFY
jgi:uncharacterized membrane protein